MIKLLNCPHDENYSYAEILDSSGRSNSFAKLAGEFPKEVQDAIDKIKPKKNKITVVIAPMGYGEVWGPNVNGDFFPREALEHKGQEYGYQTFMQANMFPHHRNKDPKKGFGKIPMAFLDKAMHRIVVISEIDIPQAKINGGMEFLKMLSNGVLPEVSMGCRVPYDVCSICSNKAKHPMYYCDHLKRGNMLRMDSNSGEVAYAINTMPKFFDLSFVHRGADRSSGTLAKIASDGGVDDTSFYMPSSYRASYYDSVQKEEDSLDSEMSNNILKLSSEIMKEDEHELFSHLRENPEISDMAMTIPRRYLSKVASDSWGEICGSFWAQGIPLKEEEIQYISLVKEGYQKLGNALYDQNLLLPYCGGYEDLPEEELSCSKISMEVAEIVCDSKTIKQPALMNRISDGVVFKQASEISNFDATKIALGTTAAYVLISKLVKQTDMLALSEIMKNNPKLIATLGVGSFSAAKMTSAFRLENIPSQHRSPFSKTAAGGFSKTFNSFKSGTKDDIKDNVSRSVANIKSGIKKIIEKTVGDNADALITSLLTAAFLGNLNGAFDKKNKFLNGNYDNKVTGIDKLITDHPYLSTAAFMTGANMGTRKLRRMVGVPMKKSAFENLVKIDLDITFPEQEKDNIEYINNFTLLMLNGG